MGTFIRHDACPECGSRDNLAVYDDGSHCFGCGYTVGENKEHSTSPTKGVSKSSDLIRDNSYQDLVARKIPKATCQKYDYQVTEHRGKTVHVATFRNKNNQPIAQKIRDADKNFVWVGNAKESVLFGQHLFNQGKMITITEGEIDCLTVSSLFNDKWPVVSVPSGAQSAKKYLAANLEFLNNFDKIVLAFDMDDPGQTAAKECAELFPPGRCAIAHLPCKDPNEALLNGKSKELINSIWDAKVFRPDGILSSRDTWDILTADVDKETAEYPWADLNKFTEGLRKGELVTVTAGSGIGKSLFCKEIAYHLLQSGHTVGYIALEESVKRTMQGLLSIKLNKPLHLRSTLVSADELHAAWEEVANHDRLYLYDHFGSADSDNLINKIRYMAKSLNCGWIFLDHISIVVSGIGDGDERRIIDNTMTKLRTLVEETGISLVCVSHLKRLEGNRGHEDGLVTSLSHLRGSAAIAQLSDLVIGLERNQQSDKKDTTLIRILKNRYSGITGEACLLRYDPQSGRLLQMKHDFKVDLEEAVKF